MKKNIFLFGFFICISFLYFFGVSFSKEPTISINKSQHKASLIIQKLEKGNHFLIGLGEDIEKINTYQAKAEILDRYINGVGSGSWVDWNSPKGEYINIVTRDADFIGAVPMFTLYQMAQWGDGNISGLNNNWYMNNYWNNIRILFQKLHIYNKSSLVNIEPDFWQYAHRLVENNDGNTLRVNVKINPDCSNFKNTLSGMSTCIIHMARLYSPKTLIGFPQAVWDYDEVAIGKYMKSLGVHNADFIIMQTLDRDAGCFEKIPQPSYCSRSGTGWYRTKTDFKNHFQSAKKLSNEIGNLPILWWQTPMGIANNKKETGGNQPGRDNRMKFLLSHTKEMVHIGGFGIVFSKGEIHQTGLENDTGQYIRLTKKYWENPEIISIKNSN